VGLAVRAPESDVGTLSRLLGMLLEDVWKVQPFLDCTIACVWVGWCGRPGLNRRSSSFLVFCVGLLARALELELSRKGAAILCIHKLNGRQPLVSQTISYIVGSHFRGKQSRAGQHIINESSSDIACYLEP